MKTYLTWTVLIWFSLLLENARPDLFLSCSLIVPVATGCIFWIRNGTAILLSGIALLLRWLLQPSLFPVEVIVNLACSTIFLSQRTFDRQWLHATSPRDRISRMMAPIVVILLALSLHSFALASLESGPLISILWPRLAIAVPFAVILAFAARISDEFGIGSHTGRI